MDIGTLAVAALPAFIASAVEFVEATTIILAVGVTRGWRAPLYGTVAAVATLAVIIAALGVTIVAVVPEHALKAVVGALLIYVRYLLHHALLQEAAHMGFAETVCPNCHMHIVASGFCPNCGVALTASPGALKRARKPVSDPANQASGPA